MKLRREFKKEEMNRFAKWRAFLKRYRHWQNTDEQMFNLICELIENHNSLCKDVEINKIIDETTRRRKECSAEIQYYWHCNLCGEYHLRGDSCPFGRTEDDQNNICPTCGKRIITTYLST